jgi:hypothetical protein
MMFDFLWCVGLLTGAPVPKHHAIKAYGGREHKLIAFLMLAVASRPGRLWVLKELSG